MCKFNIFLRENKEKDLKDLVLRQKYRNFVLYLKRKRHLKNIRKFINALIWVIAGTYLTLVILLNIPTVQNFVSQKISDALSTKLGTEVHVGNVNPGLFNRIIIDDILIYDQSHEEMLRASRVAAKINYLDLLKRKISITTGQLFGLNANLYKDTPESATNFQFVLDSLASKDQTTKTPLNLQIKSIVIRRSKLSYNVRSDSETDRISANHINFSDISAHMMLNTLTDDSLDLNIKKLTLKEKTGIYVKKFSTKCAVGRNGGKIEDFLFELPHSTVSIPYVTANYKSKDEKIDYKTLLLKGELKECNLTPSDISSFLPLLKEYDKTISLKANFNGDGDAISIPSISISQDNDFTLKAAASLANWRSKDLAWDIKTAELQTSSEGINTIAEKLGKGGSVPQQVLKLGNIHTKCSAKGDNRNISTSGILTTDIGAVDYDIKKTATIIGGELKATDIDLQALTDNADLGSLTANIKGSAMMTDKKIGAGSVQADISDFTFKKHRYSDIQATVDMDANKMMHALVNINDADGTIHLSGDYDTATKTHRAAIDADVENFNPFKLGLTDKWAETLFSFSAKAKVEGSDINSATGYVDISTFHMLSPETNYTVESMKLQKSKTEGNQHIITFVSDFARLRAEGDFDYTTLASSLAKAVKDRLPTLPGLNNVSSTNNRINLYGTIIDTRLAEHLLNLPLHLNEPAHIIADIDDSHHTFNLKVDADDFVYNGKTYREGYAIITSPNDSLKAHININKVGEKGNDSHYYIRANAVDNHLTTNVTFETNGRHSMEGAFNADARFLTNDEGQSEANISILPSGIHVADTTWTINPSQIRYYKNHLEIHDFAVLSENQHIIVDGFATKSPFDEINVNLKNVDVSYILDLVNFHSVEFDGKATGTAKARSLFDNPSAEAHLDVENFHFEGGLLGTLAADATWNKEDGAIRINGKVKDGEHLNIVSGYVSPKDNDIDLMVNADGIHVGFIENYTSTFLDNIDARAWGNVNIVGPLKKIQLVGDARVTGNLRVIPTNSSYTMRNGHVTLVPDNIHFDNDTIYDANNNIGIVNGDLFHEHLKHFTFNINAEAKNLLALNIKDFGDDVFCGTVYATGKCNIREVNGDVVIDVDATPEKGSQIMYNAASPDAITNREFIRWNDKAAKEEHTTAGNVSETATRHISSNLYLNLLIHCTPNATLKVLMDQTTGDCIALQGDGVIRASYYNKGAFDLFGNYNVQSGTYTLSVQNVLKREFEFQPGGSIVFGGDAYHAALNLLAVYTVNGVPLSDIKIGKSFTNNNVRVDCLMNISGTPGQPHVDFSLDMPTVSSDAKQMVMSLMDSEEAVNQQVLYLLAIGRFLNQNNNSSYSDVTRQSQTSLAMQSILSGTLSQQLSNMLSSIAPNNNWNIGANISTGDEGFNNAEYEGLLSGKLLNNRLLINGQFGYRDNENATSSFIGDFDLRYLLIPSGNAAVKVYNQTNDKYFTKNSLNTQGVGIILKKDFNSILDFLPWRRKKNAK